MNKYLKDSTIPIYVLNHLRSDGNTIISRVSVKKYGEEGIKKIFQQYGIKVQLEIKEPLQKQFQKKTKEKYPKEASYVLTLFSKV